MSIGVPQSDADRDEEHVQPYAQADMLKRLVAASNRLQPTISLYEARMYADNLAAYGVLKKLTVEEGSSRTTYYYAPNPDEYSNPHSTSVLIVNENQDFHRGPRWATTSFEVRLFNERGLVTHYVKKTPDGSMLEKSSSTFYSNGNVDTTTAIYPSSSPKGGMATHVRQYAEDRPDYVIFHQVTDHATGEIAVQIDERHGKSRQPESGDGLKERH